MTKPLKITFLVSLHVSPFISNFFLQGMRGDAGSPGSQGPKGDKGANGTQGPIGERGEKVPMHLIF